MILTGKGAKVTCVAPSPNGNTLSILLLGLAYIVALAALQNYFLILFLPHLSVDLLLSLIEIDSLFSERRQSAHHYPSNLVIALASFLEFSTPTWILTVAVRRHHVSQDLQRGEDQRAGISCSER